MDLNSLAKNLALRLSEQLPGPQAHELLRAKPVGQFIPKFEHKASPRLGSVLILLYPENDSIFFPLIKRPDYLGTHSGQISLPGGKAEPGEDAVETALREANEEVGADSKQIQILGKLSEFYVIPSNFLITPVVGMSFTNPSFIPDTHEVVKILTAKLSDLLREDAIQTKEILAAGRYALQAPHFEIEGEIVWGATAMILNELRMVLKEVDTGF